MNKRFFIIVLFAFIAIGLGVLFSVQVKPPQQTPVPVVHYAAAPPAIVNVPDAPTGVTVLYVGAKPTFPTSLPVYQFTNRTYTNDEIMKVAQGLGFTSAASRLLYGKETKMVWSSNESSLSFNTNGVDRSWSYVLIQSKIKTAPTQSLSDVARLFVEKHFFVNETINLAFDQEVTSPIEHIQIAESPRPAIRGYLFINKTPNSYGVVSDQFSPFMVSVVVDQYGIVRRVSFVAPPIVSQGQDHPIISMDDAVSSINKGLGLLISVTNNGDSYWEKTPQFTSVSLSDVQLVYYPDQKTSLLTPFYLFSGTANTEGGIVVDVVYAVSAIE
jgi:hypothetical protein